MDAMPAFFDHQLKMLEVGFEKNMLFAAGCGTGKTRVGVHLVEGLKAEGVTPALVIAPISLLEVAWEEDAAKFTPGLKVVNLWHPTLKGRLKKLQEEADLYVINYASWKTIRKPLYRKGIKVVLLDESSKIRNMRAAVTKMVLRYTDTIPRRFLLSATPNPNSLMDLFTQVRCVNPATLGKSFLAFRDEYFYPDQEIEVNVKLRDERRHLILDEEGRVQYERKKIVTTWKITDENRVRLLKKVSGDVMWIDKRECLDLPPVMDEIREFMMDATAKRAYIKMMTEMAVEFGDTKVLAKNALTKIMKARQITSGFLMAEGGSAVSISSKRFKLLEDELEFLGNEQVIIFATFHWEIDRIKEMLNELGKDYAELHGRVSPGQRASQINRFKSGEAQYLVAHPRSCSHGQNLQNAAYAIYFSLDYSPEEFEQSRERMSRPGQTRKMTCIFFRAKGTIDKRIYETLRAKGDIGQAALEEIRKYGKKKK